MSDPKSIAVAYLEAMGRKDFPAFESLLAPDASFKGPQATISGASQIAQAYKRLSPVLVRNELKRIFVDGNEVCVIYDYITDTPSGAVPTVEWLRIDSGKVASIFLLTDHVRWPAVLEELRRRA